MTTKTSNPYSIIVLLLPILSILPLHADDALTGNQYTQKENTLSSFVVEGIIESRGRLKAHAGFRFPDGTLQISAARSTTALEQRIAALEDLLSHFTREDDEIYITGANLNIRNGSGNTDGAVNGRGNLIVGYNEFRLIAASTCSLGKYTQEANCTDAGGIWRRNHKSGSHNVVIGVRHNYSRYGGLVAGSSNTISGDYASVSGGHNNTSNGYLSSVSGGRTNTASGSYSAVSGGNKNKASAGDSSVSGGYSNTASGLWSAVSGGALSNAIGETSSITGGNSNTAQGFDSTVSGGNGNIAHGAHATVSGGRDNDAIGDYSTASGGKNRSALSTDDWVAGSLFEPN